MCLLLALNGVGMLSCCPFPIGEVREREREIERSDVGQQHSHACRFVAGMCALSHECVDTPTPSTHPCEDKVDIGRAKRGTEHPRRACEELVERPAFKAERTRPFSPAAPFHGDFSGVCVCACRQGWNRESPGSEGLKV